MAGVFTGVGSPGAISFARGGQIFAITNLSTVPQQVAAISATRYRITFHNPGTVDLYAYQVMVQNTGSDVTLNPSYPSALGGCFLVYANGGTLIIEGECQKAWGAFSATGSNNPLTVMISHVP